MLGEGSIELSHLHEADVKLLDINTITNQVLKDFHDFPFVPVEYHKDVFERIHERQYDIYGKFNDSARKFFHKSTLKSFSSRTTITGSLFNKYFSIPFYKILGKDGYILQYTNDNGDYMQTYKLHPDTITWDVPEFMPKLIPI
jgi:hypothetical protein